MTISAIILFGNGAIACFDAQGEQVPLWQGNLFCERLREMRKAGVITNATTVNTPGTRDRDSRVADWIGE
jgi:hypothetical protein